MGRVSVNYNRPYHVDKCRSKKWFESREEAEVFAEEMQSVWKTTAFVYQCAICGLWKLTTKQIRPKLNAWYHEQEILYRQQAARESKKK